MATYLIRFIPFFQLLAPANPFRKDVYPYEQWICDGCTDFEDRNVTFRMIRIAVQIESRELYLPFDHSWLDAILNIDAKVHVTRINRSKLADISLPQYIDPPPNPYDEHFHFVVSPPNIKRNYTVTNAEDISLVDLFLARNPCFIPLHDPVLRPPSSQSQGKSKYQRSITNDEGLYYDNSAIFVRLPAYPYHTTCLFYTEITKKQFPKVCPRASEVEKLKVAWLGNIGWVNNLHPLVFYLMTSLRAGRLLITPRAHENGNEPPLYVMQHGKKVPVSGPWGAWADRDDCPIETFAWNPWACHFISLSHCNTPELHDVPSKDEYPDSPENQTDYTKLTVRQKPP
jgi:hypothetical protein